MGRDADAIYSDDESYLISAAGTSGYLLDEADPNIGLIGNVRTSRSMRYLSVKQKIVYKPPCVLLAKSRLKIASEIENQMWLTASQLGAGPEITYSYCWA